MATYVYEYFPGKPDSISTAIRGLHVGSGQPAYWINWRLLVSVSFVWHTGFLGARRLHLRASAFWSAKILHTVKKAIPLSTRAVSPQWSR